MPERQMCVKLGSGCVLIEESWFVEAWGGLITGRQFRGWMRKLGVAPINVKNRWFYEQAQVELAMTHATMGTDQSEDGVYPSFCDSVISHGRKPTVITREEAKRRRREVREELMSRKKMRVGVPVEETRRKIRKASERLGRKSRKQDE